MAKKNKIEDQFVQVEEAVSKTEQYIIDNQKSLTTILSWPSFRWNIICPPLIIPQNSS